MLTVIMLGVGAGGAVLLSVGVIRIAFGGRRLGPVDDEPVVFEPVRPAAEQPEPAPAPWPQRQTPTDLAAAYADPRPGRHRCLEQHSSDPGDTYRPTLGQGHSHALHDVPGSAAQVHRWYVLSTQAWTVLDSTDPWPTDPTGQRALAPGWREVEPPTASEVFAARRALSRYAHGSDEDLLAVARETGVTSDADR
jgi:hypothetical protein